MGILRNASVCNCFAKCKDFLDWAFISRRILDEFRSIFSFVNLTLPYNFIPSVNILNDSWPKQPQKKPHRIKVVHKSCMWFINIKKKKFSAC